MYTLSLPGERREELMLILSDDELKEKRILLTTLQIKKLLPTANTPLMLTVKKLATSEKHIKGKQN